MRKLFLTIVLALAITGSLFAGFLGAQAEIGFSSTDFSIKPVDSDEDYTKVATDDLLYLHFTGVGEIYGRGGVGAGVEGTFEKPLRMSRNDKEIDVSESPLKITEAAVYFIVNTDLGMRGNINTDAGIYYRRQRGTAMTSGVCNMFGILMKSEYIFDNAAPAIMKAGIKFKIPVISYIKDYDYYIKTEAFSISAYVTIGIGK